jgi:hypothetical protein
LPQGADAGVVPPFAGGFTGHTNDGNDTKTDERRAMTSETKRRMESAGAEVLNLTEALACMGAARGGPVADAPMRGNHAGRRALCCGSWGGEGPCYAHDPERKDERRRNASRGGRSKGTGELPDLKRQLKDLAAAVLKSDVETGRAAVANQVLNTVVRVVEQERKMREVEEMAGRLEALEEVLKGRKGA